MGLYSSVLSRAMCSFHFPHHEFLPTKISLSSPGLLISHYLIVGPNENLSSPGMVMSPVEILDPIADAGEKDGVRLRLVYSSIKSDG